VLDLARPLELGLELADLRPHRELTGRKHARHFVQLVGAYVRPG
jgi:hypothetical protein